MINPRPGTRISAHHRKNVEYCLFQSQREKWHPDMTIPLVDLRGIAVHCRKPEPGFQKPHKVRGKEAESLAGNFLVSSTQAARKGEEKEKAGV